MTSLALLATATLFGGMILYSFGLAPILFRTLSAADAGRVLRAAFPVYYLFVIAAAALAAVLLWPLSGGAAVAMAAVAVAGVVARQVLMPRINAARDARTEGGDHGRRFARLHGASVALNFLQLLIVGVVLTGFA